MTTLTIALMPSFWISAASQPVVGVWRGDSICTTDAPACHNESVVYYIRSVPDKPQVLFVQADKIVGGKAITMGSGEWELDTAGKTLTLRSEQRSWRCSSRKIKSMAC
jgi:hypothetical protein